MLAGGLLALADTASAGTVTVNPTIQGAGKVVVNTTLCEQAPPVTNATVRECATQTIDKPGQAVDVDLVATSADGGSLKGWESCPNANGARCRQRRPDTGRRDLDDRRADHSRPRPRQPPRPRPRRPLRRRPLPRLQTRRLA